MATAYVSRIILTVNGVDLDDIIISVEEDDSASTKPVVTMAKSRRAKGFKFGADLYSATIQAEEIVDPTLPDWHAMKRAKTLFKVTKQPDVGPPVSWIDCVVMSVGEKYSDGDSGRSIKIAYLRRA